MKESQGILIGEERFKKSIIKHYKAQGTNQLNVYFNTSSLHPEMKCIVFGGTVKRNIALKQLDDWFL